MSALLFTIIKLNCYNSDAIKKFQTKILIYIKVKLKINQMEVGADSH